VAVDGLEVQRDLTSGVADVVNKERQPVSGGTNGFRFYRLGPSTRGSCLSCHWVYPLRSAYTRSRRLYLAAINLFAIAPSRPS
jgi:hypothetical protein